MKQVIAYLKLFSILFFLGCNSGNGVKQNESRRENYDFDFVDWKFLGKDSSVLTKMEKKENILLDFKTNLNRTSIICISKGSGIMAANKSSSPKYDTVSVKNGRICVGFSPSDLGGFIRFRIFPNLVNSKLNNSNLLFDVEYRVDLKKNREGEVIEPFDLLLTEYVYE